MSISKIFYGTGWYTIDLFNCQEWSLPYFIHQTSYVYFCLLFQKLEREKKTKNICNVSSITQSGELWSIN